VAAPARNFFAVIDGVESPAVDAIIDNRVIFTPDGKLTAYAARSAEKWMIVPPSAIPNPLTPLPPAR